MFGPLLFEKCQDFSGSPVVYEIIEVLFSSKKKEHKISEF
jgi:hypothetical protein